MLGAINRTKESIGAEKIVAIAVFISLAISLNILESFIPYPVPGFRLGFANIITLIVLEKLGRRTAIEVVVLRIVIGAILLGSFLSPTFFMSFMPGLVSVFVISIIHFLMQKSGKSIFSLVGLSVISAVINVNMQICLAYVLFIPSQALFKLLPWLSVFAVIAGILTGCAAQFFLVYILKDVSLPHYIEKLLPKDILENASKIQQTSPIESGPERSWPCLIGVISYFCFILGLLLVPKIEFYGISVVGLIFISKIICNLSLRAILKRVIQFKWLYLMITIFTLYFHQSGVILWEVGSIAISIAGIQQAAIMILRLIVIMMASFLLINVFSWQKLVSAISFLLNPLRIVGLPVEKYAAVISLTINIFPAVFENLKEYFMAIFQEK